MIIEERGDTARPGKRAAFVETDRENGLHIQLECLGTFHGYFTTETGERNRVVAWWADDSFADREARRARMLADPRWADCLGRIADRRSLRPPASSTPCPFLPCAEASA